MRTLTRGLVAGTTSTAAMSAVMHLGRRAFAGRQPPEEIVREVVPDHRAAGPLAVLAHVGFGAGLGVLQAVLPARGPAAARGVATALAVWALSYEGWVPALGAMPPAHRDERGRQATLLAGHLVYGLVCGPLEERLRRSRNTTSESPAPQRLLARA